MIYTITALKDFIKCPQYCYNAHELLKVSEHKSANMEVGTLFHEAMELKLKGRAYTKGTALPSWADVSSEARDLWDKHRLWIPSDNFILPPQWEVLDTEIALHSPIGGVSLQGRLDAIVKYNSKFWSLQWKTYTDNLDTLLERVRLGWHEPAYQYLAEQNNYKPWGGTILGACQKLPGYRMVEISGKKQRYEITEQDRINALTMHYLIRSPIVQQRMIADIEWYLAGMNNHFHPKVVFQEAARNYDSCWGPFGTSRCPYYSVCHEGESIGSTKFVDAPPRYEEV